MSAFALKPPNRREESALQKHVATMLRAYLPAEVWWSASLSGVPLTPGVAAAAKRAGMQKGAPDLSFIFPDGLTRYIELKSPTGALTVEQKALAKTLGASLAVCRSWPEVQGAIDAWMVGTGLRWLTDTESYRRDARAA